MIKLLIVLILFPVLAFAAPAKPTITGTGPITLSGSDFGTKATASPLKFTNFDSDTVGAVPTGWDAPGSTDSLISDTIYYSGTKSLDSSALNKTADYFPRDSYDLATTIDAGGYLYLSAWMYMDKTGTTATAWNWKGPLLTSSKTTSAGANYYWEQGGATTTNTATGFAGFYDDAAPRWYNTAATVQYSSTNTAAFNYCAAGNAWASDSFVFTGWQRVEWIFKASTAATADGAITVNRIGKTASALAASGCLTYGDTSDHWRYVSLPQGITNITGGTLNLQMYFDDVYMDNTLARVELCDSSTWGARTHCEIQPPTAWSATEITATYNPGTFVTGTTAYFYVIDSDGSVSPASDAFTISGGSADTTPPVTVCNKAGRYKTSQTVALSATDDVAVSSTQYCLSTSADCTPSTSYLATVKVLVNIPYQKLCYRSTDSAENAEATKCTEYRKQRRK